MKNYLLNNISIKCFLIFSAPLTKTPVNMYSVIKEKKVIKYDENPRKSDLPVILSHKILEVMMLPLIANIRSKSGWVMCLGKPDTYKLAPFIASLLGRA